MLPRYRLVKPQSVPPKGFVTECVVAKDLLALLKHLPGVIADDRVIWRLRLR
jgi:hypothetical protein